METISQPVLGLLSDRFGRKTVLLHRVSCLDYFFALLAVAPPGIPLGLVIVAIGLFFYTLFNIFNAASSTSPAPRPAATYGLPLYHPVRRHSIADDHRLLIGGLGSSSRFDLAGVFL